MMIYGIGIDVVEVDRIEAAIERQGDAVSSQTFHRNRTALLR